MKYIVDTNVPKKASDMNVTSAIELKCAIACLGFVKDMMESSSFILVLDANSEILKEYLRVCSTGGQDNVASLFLNWVQRNLTLRAGSQIELQLITKHPDRGYEEFPDSPALEGFDVADKKFIALANAHAEHPPIIEGSDSLWWKFRSPLKDCGIEVVFLCEDYVRTKNEEIR